MKTVIITYYSELMFIFLNKFQLQNKDILTEILFYKKRLEALEENLDCQFIRVNPSKENCDADNEIGRIQGFVSEI